MPRPRADDDSAAMASFYLQIGRRIRELRQQRHFTQSRLSELSGVRTTYIAEIEGVGVNLSLKLLHQLAHALNVSVRDLVAGPDKADTAAANIASVVRARVTSLKEEVTRHCDGIITFVDTGKPG